MKVSKGFVLLEIVIALFVGSLIAGILFQSLAQSNKIFAKITSLSSIERTMAIVQQQMENDFSGICVPPDPAEKKDQADENKDENKKKENALPEKDAKKLKGCALELGQKGETELFSFITSNPLPTYHQGSPRAVRVAYRVIADPEHEGKLLMVRQQSDELNLEKFKQASRAATRKEDQQPIRSFEVVRNLTSFSCALFVELLKKQEEKKSWQTAEQKAAEKDKNKKADEPEPKEEGRKFISVQEWFGYSDEEKNKFEEPRIPTFLKIEISAADELEKVRTFEFWFAAAGGCGIFQRVGATELPSDHELYQRDAANKEERRIHLHDGIPQPEELKG